MLVFFDCGRRKSRAEVNVASRVERLLLPRLRPRLRLRQPAPGRASERAGELCCVVRARPILVYDTSCKSSMSEASEQKNR